MKDLFGDDIEVRPKKPKPEPKPEQVRKTQGTLFDAGFNDLPGQTYMFDEWDDNRGIQNAGDIT